MLPPETSFSKWPRLQRGPPTPLLSFLRTRDTSHVVATDERSE